MEKFEVWSDPEDNSISVFGAEDFVNKKKMLSSKAKLLRVIEADTWNDAMTQHHQLMGWEPYKPF